jgi:PAS domain S-box-containing protein
MMIGNESAGDLIMPNSEGKKRPLGRVETMQKRRRKSEYTRVNAAGVESTKGSENTHDEKYSTLLQNIPCAVYSAYPGKAGPTTFISNKWKDWTGYSPEELYQDPEAWPKCIHPDEREKAINAYSRACRDEAAYNLEYRIIHKHTGQVRCVRDRGLLSKDKKGEIIRVDGIITDISELKQAEKSQRESEERFSNFLDNLGDVAYETDGSGNVTYANKMGEKITGVPLKDIIGKPFLPLFTKESQQIAIDVYDRTLQGESAEYELTFANGKVCHFKNEPLRDETGKITGVFGIARDITEHRQVEKALGKSQEQFKNLFNNALVGLYRTTPDGRILMANPAIVRMLGYDSFEELARRNLEEEGFEPQYFRSDFKERIEATGRVIGLEADWVRRDGTILSVRESARAIHDELGNILYYEGTVEDITERKRAEEELRRHRDHLEEMVATRTREMKKNNETLQTEITERKQTEEALKAAEIRFRSLIEQTTDAVFCYEYDPPIPTGLPLEQQVRLLYDGILVECNDVCAKSYGADRAGDVIGRRLKELFGATPGSLDKLFTAMIEGEYRIVDGEGTEKLEDGTKRYFLNNGHGVIEDGKLIRVWGTFRDITEHRRMENLVGIERDLAMELANTNKLQDGLRICLEAAMKASGMDCGGVYLFNETSRTLELAYHKGLSSDFAKSVLHYDEDSANMQLVIKCEPVYTEHEKLGIPLDGNELHEGLKAIAVVPMIDKGQVVGCMNVASHSLEVFPAWSRAALETVTVEISSMIRRLKAEEALTESESRFRELVENMHEVFWMENADGTELLYVSPMYEQLWGRSCQSFYENPKDWIESIHPEDRQRVAKAFSQFRETGEYSEKFRIVRPDGMIRWIWDRGVLIRNESGKITRVAGVAEDITGRKRAEDALRTREQMLRALLNAPTESAILVDTEGTILDINRIAAQRLGKSAESLIGMGIYDYLPADIAEYRKKQGDEVIRSGKPVRFQDDREGRYYDTNVYPVFDDEGKVSALAVFSGDITGRKRAAEALKESEEKFRSLAEQSPNMIFINKKGKVVYTNKKCEEVMEYTREELCSPDFDFLTLIAPESMAIVRENFARHLRGEDVRPYDYCLTNKKGERIEAINASKLIQYEGETAILGVVTDITERKRAEQALRESEERLKILFESAPDAIYLIDSEGRFIDGNRAAEELIGFTKDEIIGKSLAETGLLSAGQLSKAIANLKKTAASKLSDPNEYNLKRKDGNYVSVEVRTFPVRIGGEMLSLGIARDITEHKRAEKKTLEHQAKLKSLASQLSLTEEHERHRLATELHDQISQSLVISKIKLDQLRKSSTSDEFDEPLEDVCNCLGQIINDTRTLTFDLSYPILYELGFEAAVAEWLTDQIQEKHGIKTECVDDGRQKPLDDDILVLLFRNVRELLINVVKHAQANKVIVSIRKVKDNICVSVEDDGVGFDPDEVTSMATKRAEFGLFSIRERLEQLGGMIEIDSEMGRGSKITMTAPLKNENEADRV